MKKFGSKSGFTLVELIVVIAILGILAGIAVPAYSGYIKKANEAADYAQLDAIKTAVVFAYTDKHVKDDDFKDITKITVAPATGTGAKGSAGTGAKGSAVTIYAGNTTPITDVTATDIKPYYNLEEFTFKSNTKQADWNSVESGSGANKVAAGWTLTPKD